MAMKGILAPLLVAFLCATGCTWFGLVEEEKEFVLGIPGRGAITLIGEISVRTANVEFSSWDLELDPRPSVRVKGRATSAAAIASLLELMKESPDFEGVEKAWGIPSEYEEVRFALQGGVSVPMPVEISVKEGDWIEGSSLLNRILSQDSSGAFEDSLSAVSFAFRDTGNGWRYEKVKMWYEPNDRNRMGLPHFLDAMKKVEDDFPTVRAMIVHLEVEKGQVFCAEIEWNCYRPPGK